jgi:two-component system, NtrC family, nitrogen regulation sensor histidine kinase NtrY
VDRLRNRLIAAFLVATMVPLAATIWIATSLIDESLDYATTTELDTLSRTFEQVVRRFYQRERDSLREDAAAARLAPTRLNTSTLSVWPEEARLLWESGETERFALAEPGGTRLDFMRRASDGVELFSRDLGDIRMQDVTAEFSRARALVDRSAGRDLRRGFTLTFYLLIAGVWLVSLAPLLFIAYRVTRPIEALTAGLTDFAGGDWNRRLDNTRQDEVGRAVDAFNHMASELRDNRDRLVYLAQMSSWQTLARKTAHELKNSLTPIRLTVEEMLARQPAGDRAFMQQATDIVVSEIEALEARVRAFSEFASDPPVRPESVDVNMLVSERVALLKLANPGVNYQAGLDETSPRAFVSPDLAKSTLTNLLENAAHAAGPNGIVRIITKTDGKSVVIEVHDSGPGLSEEARRTLFEPTITFKKHGMGLGLSIARKNALASGGDVTLVAGQLSGAAFRVALPSADPS